MRKIFPYISFLVLIIIFIIFIRLIYPIKYRDLIVKYSVEYDIAPEIISALINTESSFNKDAVSDAGAKGLMQVLPSTADEIGQKLDKTDYNLSDPNTNIQFGCYYLRYLLDYYSNDYIYALCAYNAGINNVKHWNFNGDIETIPVKQTKNYVKKIVKSIQVYKAFYY